SHYNALQIKGEKRFSSGLQFLAHYTYSHAIYWDNNYYSADQAIAKGPDPFSRNHVFVANVVYLLPFGRGGRFMSDASRWMDLIVGGGQMSNTRNWSSGLPWTPSIGECGQVTDAGPCRPDLVSGQSFSVGPRKVNGQWYEFVPVAPLSYGLTTADVGVDTCTL